MSFASIRWLAMAGMDLTLLVAQAPPDEPRLVVASHEITRAKFPFVDVNSTLRPNITRNQIQSVVQAMDDMNMRVLVDTRGGSGDEFASRISALKAYSDRFIVFCNLDLADIDDSGWAARATARLREDVKSGARGLKIFNNLGLDLKDSKGARIQLDDPRFDAVWEEAGRLKIPVLIQSGRLPAVFQTQGRFGGRRGGRSGSPAGDPTPDVLQAEQRHVIEKHPSVTFISANLAGMGGNLEELGRWMDQLPNMFVETGAVMAELGRQPRSARHWLIRYQNRVLFGKGNWAPDEYRTYFRVLETPDEYFDYAGKPRDMWQMYGLDLPDLVTRKISYGTALKLIPGLDAKAFHQ